MNLLIIMLIQYLLNMFLESVINHQINNGINYLFISQKLNADLNKIILIELSEEGKYTKYPGGIRYHVYVDGYHERWSRHERNQDDLQKCSKCSKFDSTYYELESWE